MAQSRVPFATTLAQLVIAFTIECDNESERAYREAGSKRRFLVSLAFMANYLRYVRAEGTPIEAIAARALVSKASVTARLRALERWGYVAIEGDAVRATSAGSLALKIFQPLPGLIEERWMRRFGTPALAALRGQLEAVAARIPRGLPYALPITGNGMGANIIDAHPWFVDIPGDGDLIALLSRVLSMFALGFEVNSPVSLPIGANALRVLTEGGVRVRDLPRMTGTSKEAVAVSLGYLRRSKLITIVSDARAVRTNVARLTLTGTIAQVAFAARYAELEASWATLYGAPTIAALRTAARALLDARADGKPLLAEGLRPPANGWRTQKPYDAQLARLLRDPASALPHYPMISHRGGWPDGS